MHIPYDAELGVHQQSEGFTRLRRSGTSRPPADKYPLLLHYPYFDLYRKQVVKQADLVLAMHWCAATRSPPSRRPATSPTTSARTVRDSSLSACTQAVLAAEVGHLDLAHDYAARPP